MTAAASLAGKRVLVTGGSRGIGAAVAEAYACSGARVALTYQRDQEAASATLESLRGGGHCAIAADVSEASSVASLLERVIAEFDGLDIVVNNAGVFVPHAVADVDFEIWRAAWQSTLAVNLIGAANVCFLAARHMMGQPGGKIINISSRGAFRGEPDAPAYGASKAGLNALTQSLSIALAPHGVFVAAIAPGFVDTDMAASVLSGEKGDEIRAQSPLGRVGTPAEVAKMCVLLSSDGIDFATGTIVDMNGASYLRS